MVTTINCSLYISLVSLTLARHGSDQSIHAYTFCYSTSVVVFDIIININHPTHVGHRSTAACEVSSNDRLGRGCAKRQSSLKETRDMAMGQGITPVHPRSTVKVLGCRSDPTQCMMQSGQLYLTISTCQRQHTSYEYSTLVPEGASVAKC